LAKNPLSSLYNEQKQKPYQGTITFTDKIINYDDNTLLIGNVSQFSKYGFKKKYMAAIVLLTIGTLALIAAINNASFLIALPALLLIALGIWDIKKPKLYGLTIELNSGSRHYFFSKDLKGIERLFLDITEAIYRHSPFMMVTKFEDNRITITDSNIGNIGDKSSGNTFNFKP
jgi:hypothetical protein